LKPRDYFCIALLSFLQGLKPAFIEPATGGLKSQLLKASPGLCLCRFASQALKPDLHLRRPIRDSIDKSARFGSLARLKPGPYTPQVART